MYMYIGLSLEPCFNSDYIDCFANFDLPEDVQKYCQSTRKRYIQQPVLPESVWPPNLGGEFIRSALIKQGRTRHDFSRGAVIELQEYYVRGKYDIILERKTEIELEEIFEPVFHEEGYELPLKVLVDGAPGVGKTTLSRKVSQKWAKSEILQRYYLVLLLHLRERNIRKATKIDQFFFHDNPVVNNAMITFVKATSGRGVLIIFDGFDELSLAERQCHKDSVYLKIIQGKILSECAVVVTSRPYASRPLQELQSVNRHVEVLGFTNKEIHECIKQAIKDKDKAEQLCTELEDRLDIASICQIPLTCSIVLYVYEMEDYRLPDTLTELYELFILHCLRRHTERTQNANAAQSLRKLPDPIQERFDILAKLAYSSLKEDKLVFEREDLEQAFSLTFSTDVPVLGLMTSAKSYSSRGTHDTYSFLHLIIQEYLCAFWAAKTLTEREKLDFIKDNMKNERYYMVLWFFAGITKLDISDVRSIFNRGLWEYNDHKHICHLLYESDASNHSLCNYVAENYISTKEVNLSQRWYSRFDRLMIIHFLAHSSCQWNSLILGVDDVKILHKVFTGLKPCNTAIRRVTINITKPDVADFHEGLLQELPHIVSVQLDLSLDSVMKAAHQTLKSSFKNVVIKTKVIKSVCLKVTGINKHHTTRNLYDGLFEGIAHGSFLVSDLDLKYLAIEDFEHLFSLLIRLNSNIRLETLSASEVTGNCHDQRRCHEFCTLLSTFLSKNVPLRKLDMSLPFQIKHFVNCVDTIQSGLDQNSTLEELNIDSEIIYRRSKHTSKLELVKGHDLFQLRPTCSQAATNDDAGPSGAVPQPVLPHCQLGSNSIQTHCRMPSTDSESPYLDDDVDSFLTSPAKRPKIGNSSGRSPCQTTRVHVQPQPDPQQPQPPVTVFPSSDLPIVTRSTPLSPPAPLYSSQCVTVCPQPQPSYFMAGSSSTRETYHSVSRNYQIPLRERSDRRYQSWNNMMPRSPHVPHGLGSTTTTLPLVGPIPPTMMQSQPYMMPYQHQSHNILSHHHVNPSYNFYLPTLPQYSHFYPDMNPAQNMLPAICPYPPSVPTQRFMMPPRLPQTAGHTMRPFTSELEQYRPATANAPPVLAIYNPYYTGGTPLITSIGNSPSPLPTTSTST